MVTALLNKTLGSPVMATAIPVILGLVSGSMTRSQIRPWYDGLKKPKGTPPRWMFPLAWTYLYATMGYAAYLLAKKLHDTNVRVDAHTALNLYWISLAVNLSWTSIFFGLHETGYALLNIGVLWASVVGLTAKAFKVDTPAAWLLIPYVAWISYASYLNYVGIFATSGSLSQLIWQGIWNLNFKKRKP